MEQKQPPGGEHDHRQGDRNPENSLRPVDDVCEGLVWRDAEHVSGIGEEERAGKLAAERRGVGGGDHTPRGARPRAPLGKGQHELNEERQPETLEQKAEGPEAVRGRPLKVGNQESERGGREQDS